MNAPHRDDPGDPPERHREKAAEVLLAGDPAAIKRLYVELGDFFDEAAGAESYEAPVLSLPETGPVVAGLMEGVTGRVLDAGCGPNPATSLGVARAGGRTVVGMDLGFGTVKLARAIAATEGVPFLAVVGDLEALPFRDGAMDGVVCDDTIEHVPHDEVAVAELARALKADGVGVLATPNRHNARIVKQKVADRLRGRRRPDEDYFVASSHLREYTWREFERLVAPRMGIVDRAAVGWHTGGWRRRLLSALVRLPGLRRADQMIVLKVRPR